MTVFADEFAPLSEQEITAILGYLHERGSGHIDADGTDYYLGVLTFRGTAVVAVCDASGLWIISGEKYRRDHMTLRWPRFSSEAATWN